MVINSPKWVDDVAFKTLCYQAQQLMVGEMVNIALSKLSHLVFKVAMSEEFEIESYVYDWGISCYDEADRRSIDYLIEHCIRKATPRFSDGEYDPEFVSACNQVQTPELEAARKLMKDRLTMFETMAGVIADMTPGLNCSSATLLKEVMRAVTEGEGYKPPEKPPFKKEKTNVVQTGKTS